MLPVIFAHVGLPGFSGGFVGVDVFFVISGFLITGIILRDLAAGRHSVTQFYRRRVLRIFPVLVAVLAVTTALACLVMLPVELVRFARSLGASALFGSNILFYFESNYFDAASTTKPLLHLWSLAVEEQFYIFWPLLLAGIGVARPATLRASVLLLTVFSLLAAVIVLQWDMSASFYLLPLRAWELGVGALLALGGRPLRSQWLNELLAAVGIALILFAVWQYHEYTRFPGLAALPPCLGAMLIILTGPANTWVSRLLSLAPFTFVGKISFSLYMWHWPVVVFGKLWLLLPNDQLGVQVGEVLLSLALATLSWRFVEQPFRRNFDHCRTRHILFAGAVAMLLFAGVAATLIGLRGLPWRFTENEQVVARYLEIDGEQSYRRGTCFRVTPYAQLDPRCLVAKGDRPALLLLGDSHAAHLRPGLAAEARNYEVLQATMASCRPLLHPDPTTNCRRLFNDMLRNWAPRHRPALVVLSANWRMRDVDLLKRTLADPQVRRLNLIVVGPIPQYSAPLPRLLVLADKWRDPDLVQRSTLKIAFEMDGEIGKVARDAGVRYVSLVDMLCAGPRCRTLAAPGTPMQFDASHLTSEGSAFVARGLLPYIDTAIAGQSSDVTVPRASPE